MHLKITIYVSESNQTKLKRSETRKETERVDSPSRNGNLRKEKTSQPIHDRRCCGRDQAREVEKRHR